MKRRKIADSLCSAADDYGYCPCGLCGRAWIQDGGSCDCTELAYLPSGREVKLGPGCRQRIATDCNVPPGFISRCGTSLHIGKCPGKLGRPVGPLEYGMHGCVPFLPLEYYSRLVVDLMLRDIFIGADGSAFVITKLRPFPVVFHVLEMKLGTVHALHGVVPIEFSSGYGSATLMLDVVRGRFGPIWLSHEVVSVNPCSRCSRNIAILQNLFRRRRASR